MWNREFRNRLLTVLGEIRDAINNHAKEIEIMAGILETKLNDLASAISDQMTQTANAVAALGASQDVIDEINAAGTRIDEMITTLRSDDSPSE